MCILRFDLMNVYNSMYFYYLLLFVMHVLSFDKLGNLLMYLSLSGIRCISAKLLYVCQTIGARIGKWLPKQATADNIVSYIGSTEIGNSCKI